MVFNFEMFTSVFTAVTEVVDVAATDVVAAVAEVVESTVVPVDVAAFGLEGEEGEGEGVPLLSLTCPFTCSRHCTIKN